MQDADPGQTEVKVHNWRNRQNRTIRKRVTAVTPAASNCSMPTRASMAHPDTALLKTSVVTVLTACGHHRWTVIGKRFQGGSHALGSSIGAQATRQEIERRPIAGRRLTT
jgi:hypothetical protein